MTTRSVTHATFCIERTYDASPARVFAAFADPAAKAQWFKGPDEWQKEPSVYDFRVGGHERSTGAPPGEPMHIFSCVYRDIVPNERIVYTYDMHMGETLTSVSVTTIEFKAAGAGTTLVFSEQGAFVDGHHDPKGREEGTGGLLEALGAFLTTHPADA